MVPTKHGRLLLKNPVNLTEKDMFLFNLWLVLNFTSQNVFSVVFPRLAYTELQSHVKAEAVLSLVVNLSQFRQKTIKFKLCQNILIVFKK